jgi:ubiquinone/menaquinone biosynthesis C-methylase UbiE
LEIQVICYKSQQRFKKVKVANNTKNKKSFSILDVGCGNPSFLNAIKKNLHADCTGIDFLIMDGR